MFVLSLRWLRLNIEASLMFAMQRSLMHPLCVKMIFTHLNA